MKRDEYYEERVVSSTNASVEPWAVMVESVDALVAYIAVSTTRQNDDLTLRAQFC